MSINCHFKKEKSKAKVLLSCWMWEVNVEALSLCVGSFYIEMFYNSKESNESQEM